jgi:hypothetical protein
MKKAELENWAEAHYEFVRLIEEARQQENPTMEFIENTTGIGGFWQLAFDMTQEYEKLHKGRQWYGDWLDEIESFFETKLQTLPV